MDLTPRLTQARHEIATCRAHIAAADATVTAALRRVEELTRQLDAVTELGGTKAEIHWGVQHVHNPNGLVVRDTGPDASIAATIAEREGGTLVARLVTEWDHPDRIRDARDRARRLEAAS